MAEIAGLKLIVPTSVAGSGVSVSASGKVTFTAATSASINGVFTSTYDNYLLVMRYIGSGDNPLRARLRLSGTDATGNDYTFQYLDVDNTSVSGARLTTSSTQISGLTATREGGAHLYVYGPNLAQPTAFRSVSVRGTSSAFINDNAGTHSLSTAYDGITLRSDNGTTTFTGACTVYGLSQ